MAQPYSSLEEDVRPERQACWLLQRGFDRSRADEDEEEEDEGAVAGTSSCDQRDMRGCLAPLLGHTVGGWLGQRGRVRALSLSREYAWQRCAYVCVCVYVRARR